MERTALQRAQRVFLLALAFLFVVLLASGLWLTFRYRPGPDSWVRITHRVTSVVFLGAAVLTFGVSIAVSYERRLRAGIPAWVVGIVLVLGVGTAAISGYLLPWDQLALTVVRVNVDYSGFGFLFGTSDVRFVLLGSVEVSTSTVRQWFLFHTVAIPVSLLVIGTVLWRVTRRGRLLPLEPEPEPQPEPDAGPSAAPPS